VANVVGSDSTHTCPKKNLEQDCATQSALDTLFDLTNVLAYFFGVFSK